MLRLIIQGIELWNETEQVFEKETEDVVLELEHSLISLSKWESKYKKPFLSSGEKTNEELIDYVKTMIVTPNVDIDILRRCSANHIEQIQNYIDSSESATTFGSMPDRKGSNEVITAELIYYWMVAFNIPFECQYWHLNRLFALIRICNIKNSKPKKMSRHELAERNRRLNEERRKALGSSG